MVRDFARARSITDHATPGSRRVHVGAIPRLGGVAIVAAFLVPVGAVYVVPSQLALRLQHTGPDLRWLVLGGIVIALLGVYDDVLGADARLKFVVQFAVAAAMYWAGIRVTHISVGGGHTLLLGWAALPITLLWVVGVTNALNLIDGLDGLAGGVALIALGATFVISAMRSEVMMMLVCASLAGAVLGFLLYNFNPASIFMGDTGSMFLGFMLAVGSITAGEKASTTISFVIPVLILALPIGDTMLAIVRRSLRRESLFTADRDHLHHRLLRVGLSQREAVFVLYSL
jgi:UDP-GlcNAc:undecaprenyl-phosphate GlcNAc-1-phosphate transferase